MMEQKYIEELKYPIATPKKILIWLFFTVFREYIYQKITYRHYAIGLYL